MRVLVIAGSMPLPTDELRYEDTWIYRLAKDMPELEIVDKCVRARPVSTLMHGGPFGQAKNLFEWYRPDLIIIHMGLTDCAPRLLRRKSFTYKLLCHLPFAKPIFSALRKYRGRRVEYADITPKDFYENFNGYALKAAQLPVVIVKISNVIGHALERSPLFNKSISLYNKLLERVAEENENVIIVDGLDGSDSSMYQSDGMHLTAKGQAIILNKLEIAICNKLNIKILPPPPAQTHLQH